MSRRFFVPLLAVYTVVFITRRILLRVEFANLGACPLPGTPASAVPLSSSLVNLYRAILNHYLEAGLERLPDRYCVGVRNTLRPDGGCSGGSGGPSTVCYLGGRSRACAESTDTLAVCP